MSNIVNSSTMFDELKSSLSPQSSISFNQSTLPRWSDYHEPIAQAVVSPATEHDVQATVQFCVKHKIPFLAQSGGHGWSKSINLPSNGVILNMRKLNSVTFNDDKTLATIGGGAISSEVIDAAYSHDTQVQTGNCNAVGVLGAALGGGYGNLLGEHGFSVDQFKSMNVVLVDGSLRTITSADKDLWWAMRGAGPNFGVVTSATMQAYPTPRNQSFAFTPALFFDESKLGNLVDAINKLDLKPNMNIYLYYITMNNTPSIMVTIFFIGSEEQAKEAYASIYDLGPSTTAGGITPYNQWNAAGSSFNIKGDRKPSYGVSFTNLDRDAWVQIWQGYKELVSNPTYNQSLVICEAYSLKVAQSLEPDGPGTASSWVGRHYRFNAAAIEWYPNSTSLDAKAEAFGSRARSLMRQTGNFTTQYVNFAFGDETPEQIYGPALPRLKSIKKQYDPSDVFGAWFNVAPS